MPAIVYDKAKVLVSQKEEPQISELMNEPEIIIDPTDLTDLTDPTGLAGLAGHSRAHETPELILIDKANTLVSQEEEPQSSELMNEPEIITDLTDLTDLTDHTRAPESPEPILIDSPSVAAPYSTTQAASPQSPAVYLAFPVPSTQPLLLTTTDTVNLSESTLCGDQPMFHMSPPQTSPISANDYDLVGHMVDYIRPNVPTYTCSTPNRMNPFL